MKSHWLGWTLFSLGCGPVGPSPGPIPSADPRPPAERACPAGTTVRVRPAYAYALPMRPDGEPWDGVSVANRALFCRETGSQVRARVRDALNASYALAGSTIDRAIGDRFQSAVADACGLVTNWLQMRFEGPDMFARSDWGRSIQTEDRWIAPIDHTSAGGRSGWQYPCGERGVFVDIEVVDADLVIDDPVGNVSFELTGAPPAVLCDGWGWVEGDGGLMGVLVLLEHDGLGQNCDGLGSPRFEDHTIPTRPVRRRPTTTPPSTPRDPSGATGLASPAPAPRSGA